VTKSYYSISGDSENKKKEVGLMEVVKNCFVKVYPYLVIFKVIMIIHGFFFG
jgi:hypothetical protein